MCENMCGYKLFASSFSDASINPKMSAQHGCISFIELAAFFLCMSFYMIYYFLFVFVVVLLSWPAY